MGFILLFLLFAACIWVPIFVYNWPHEKGICAAGFSIPNIMAAIIVLVVIATSYDSYVATRVFYDATREQYAEAVKVYQDHAVIDMGAATFTDMKYQGYQQQVGELIMDLRKQIVRYNTEITSKRIMDKSWFYSWLIIAPDDDMKIIKMKAPTAGMPE